MAALVAFWLPWGLVGSRYVRLAQFLRGPSTMIAYAGNMAMEQDRRYLGNNAAGAAMIVALLVTLSGNAFVVWLMEEPDRLATLPDCRRSSPGLIRH